MSENTRIKPVVVLAKGEVSKRDIKRLNDNGLCVVEANDPSKVRFIDPPPEGYAVQERAAIQLFRSLMSRSGFSLSRAGLSELYADILLEGWPMPRVEQVKRAAK
jgi:hypothetical protein